MRLNMQEREGGRENKESLGDAECLMICGWFSMELSWRGTSLPELADISGFIGRTTAAAGV